MGAQRGISFEKIVAEIQAQLDPNTAVLHDEILKDRLGQKRQFDIVIKGRLAGQDILGVIECKDFKKRIGTPEIDGFVTKTQDINANFKIFVSRNGFTLPAIQKATHYGIQTLSLIPNENSRTSFKLGNYWFVDIYFWEQILIRLKFDEEPNKTIDFNAEEVKVDGKRVIDWYKNYLAENYDSAMELGWIAGVGIDFKNPIEIEISQNKIEICSGLEFFAKRNLKKKRKFVGINGVGFFNWQNRKYTLPPKSKLETDHVQTNFLEWEDRDSDEFEKGGFIHLKLVVCDSLKKIRDAIDLDAY